MINRPVEKSAKARRTQSARYQAYGKKIVVGMSGGVDSSIALYLLKEQGWQPIGVSLRYAVWQDKENQLRENVCCSAESFQIAKAVCKKLHVPHHIIDVEKDFKKKVIDYFIGDLKMNRTPNPCIMCNRHLKFKKLFAAAKSLGANYVATGHYARTHKNAKTGNYELLKARDGKKDQTYSLCFLPQKWLAKIIFPLGKYTKKEVFKLANKIGFRIFLKRKQSQDFCFVAGRSMKRFLKKELGEKEGNIADVAGNQLGKHKGLHFYTIGQRRGINLPGGPYFVVRLNRKENTLIVSQDKKDLYRKEIVLSPCHFISGDAPRDTLRVKAKTRHLQPLASATLARASKNNTQLMFDRPQKAVTPGQFAVFYNRATCLGGGIIAK